jgi:aromatic ring-opening dioxygenase catalytic subunit (LigB family)
MGQIVAAMATVHAPQLFTRPPSEDPAQLDADLAAMRQLGKTLDETKPDLVIIIGSDHLETFFLSSVPTFAVIAGERTNAAFAGRKYSIPTQLPFAEQMLDDLVRDGFDMSYSQDAELGHSFAAVFEWVLEGREIPVVPIFVNTYLPPLPTPRRAEALGKAIKKVIDSRPERVAIVASGGMSHYPGTWKYSLPAFDFDYWAIAHMERGNHDVLLNLTVEQLDEVGNTEMLPWLIMFGAIGRPPGELITYQPTWHHGHAVMRFIPTRTTAPDSVEPKPAWEFENKGGYQFYKHPSPATYNLNKLIYDLRHDQKLRIALLEEPKAVAKDYHLTQAEMEKVDTLADESIDVFRSLKSHPLVELGAHPLGLLMCLVVVQAEGRRLRREKEQQRQPQEVTK